MKSKAPLLLMEQMVMLLVFALAAALCIQAFVKSDAISRTCEARDRAVVLCQNAAEAVRHSGGDFAAAAALLGADRHDQDSLSLDYDSQWNPAQDTMRYTLGVYRLDSGVAGLGKAEIWLRDEAEDVELLRMDVAWQVVSAHG